MNVDNKKNENIPYLHTQHNFKTVKHYIKNFKFNMNSDMNIYFLVNY